MSTNGDSRNKGAGAAPHSNAFGFLRLMFASMVILAHTPQLVDGNEHRELLTRLFGTSTFGDLAVDGFFLISGYLIAGSYLRKPRPLQFLAHRIARIYPAFLCASLICLLCVAPFSGIAPGWLSNSVALRSLWNMATLQQPELIGVFPGTPHAKLNGAMWTLPYEFRCYLMVLLLGIAGALGKPRIMISIAALSLAAILLLPKDIFVWIEHWNALSWVLGDPHQMLRFVAVFLTGSVFLLYRRYIHFDYRIAILAAIGLAFALTIQRLSTPAVAVAGGYLVFYVAGSGRFRFLSEINSRTDISYGVYLYAWPLTKLFNWWFPQLPLIMLGLLTLATSVVCGLVSWKIIEKPIMDIVKRRAALSDRPTDVTTTSVPLPTAG
jgi:peptidoglycan/LPS O-acetylase OafA/YrhL